MSKHVIPVLLAVARYYTLTRDGRKHLAAERKEFDAVIAAIQRVMETA